MKRLRNILMTLGGVITTVFLLYTLAMVVFGICALCGAFSAVPEGSLWVVTITAFVLGYLAVVVAAGVCDLLWFVVLVIETLRDKEKGWPRLLKWGKWFAVGAVIALSAVLIRYWIKGSFFTSDVPFVLYGGMLSFWIFAKKIERPTKTRTPVIPDQTHRQTFPPVPSAFVTG